MVIGTGEMHAMRQRHLLLISLLFGLAVLIYFYWSGSKVATQPVAAGKTVTVEQATEETSAQTSIARRTRPSTVTADQKMLSVPSRFALFPGLEVPEVDSWDALLEGLEPEERALVEAFTARYPGAFQIKSVEQLRWMLERGYPMPEEILLAESMAVDSLIEMAKSGNDKAAMLAVDRLTETEPRVELDFLDGYERYKQNMPLMDQLHASCSPFGYYVAARSPYLVNPAGFDGVGIWELTHLLAALRLGDERIEYLLNSTAREIGYSREAISLVSLYDGDTSGMRRDDCKRRAFP